MTSLPARDPARICLCSTFGWLWSFNTAAATDHLVEVDRAVRGSRFSRDDNTQVYLTSPLLEPPLDDYADKSVL